MNQGLFNEWLHESNENKNLGKLFIFVVNCYQKVVYSKQKQGPSESLRYFRYFSLFVLQVARIDTVRIRSQKLEQTLIYVLKNPRILSYLSFESDLELQQNRFLYELINLNVKRFTEGEKANLFSAIKRLPTFDLLKVYIWDLEDNLSECFATFLSNKTLAKTLFYKWIFQKMHAVTAETLFT